MEPFYFKSFERVIGVACDVPGLYYTIKCLSVYDRPAVEYHIKQRHIADWLDYIGNHELSKMMNNAESVEEAIAILEQYLKNVKQPTKKLMQKTQQKGSKRTS